MKHLGLLFFSLILSFASFAAIGPITGDTVICAGRTGTLSNSTTGGSWSSSNPTVCSINASTGVYIAYIWGSPASVLITYTAASGTATATVRINADPGYIYNYSSPICPGGSMTLADTAHGGRWSSSNTSVATIDSVTGYITGGAVGSATISYTAPGGCSATQSVNVAPIHPITVPSPLCTGHAAYIIDSTPGGTWSTSSPFIGTLNPYSGYLLGTSAAAYTITYTTATCHTTLAVTINQTPDAIYGLTALCTGSVLQLSDAMPGGTWSSTTTAISINPTSGLATGDLPGSTIIIYSMPTQCFASASVSVSASICGGGGSASSVATIGCASDTLTAPNYSCTNFQWQISTDNITWTDIPSAISYDYIFAPPTTSNYYRCVITCQSSGAITYTASSFINGTRPALQSVINHSLDTVCGGLGINVITCGPAGAYNVTTYFGDGTNNNVILTTGSAPSAAVTHIYAAPGTYTIKQVLYNGTTPVDSVIFPYEYLYCHMLPLKFYFDNNHNCSFDASETYNYRSISVEVDSNGVAIDTLSATSGFYYAAHGLPGTVYTFSILPGSALTFSCAIAISDTIQAYVDNYPVQYYGLTCSTSPGFDLAETVTMHCGRHMADGTVVLSNLICFPTAATFTVYFSPQYNYTSAVPAPASHTANSITWNIASLSPDTAPQIISFHLDVPTPLIFSTWLLPGDTINTSYRITPYTGDVDTTNNFIARVDTVKTSYDPNYIEANPAGYILPGAQLQYTVHFENTGNDTAHNIYVMDTLSDNLDPHSLEIVTASSVMNIVMLNDGMHNIVKFDFPNIKLLDSSHHGYCDGLVSYKINQIAGLTDGTNIYNHAGIFFDDNEVVMTNTIDNIIALIHGTSIACTGLNDTLTELAQGGTWTSSNTHATVSGGIVTGVTPGTDTISYTITYANGPITVDKIITINPGPVAGTISGPSVVCEFASITISDDAAGGTWSAGTGVFISGGLVTGTTAGTSVVSYAVTNSCGTAVATYSVTVNPLPHAGTIVGLSTVCTGASITLTDSSPGGVWALSNGNATISGHTVTGVTAGSDTVLYTVTNSCGFETSKLSIVIDPCPTVVSTIAQTDNVDIYPNPTTGELVITTSIGAYNTFTITNQMGQTLIQQPLSATQTNVNIQSLPAGIYYINLKGSSGTKVMKIVKM